MAMPAADPGEQGERLAETDDGGFTVVQSGQATRRRGVEVDGRVGRAGGKLRARCGCGVGLRGRSPAQGFTGQQDQSVDGEEDGRGQRFGEQGAEGVFQGQPGDADRDRGDDEKPGESFVGVGGDDAPRGDAGPKGAPEPADDPHPVGSEEDDQGQCGRYMQGDDDRQVGA
jgi:hypothetical protein